jgi:thiol-disulfide isomerase/thioredoxin
MRNIKLIKEVMIVSMLLIALSCYSQQKPVTELKPDSKTPKYKVTFVELGSVKCIPCQQMQPVMKAIETKYGKEVKVDFHDVWTDAGRFSLMKPARNITGMWVFSRKRSLLRY